MNPTPTPSVEELTLQLAVAKTEKDVLSTHLEYARKHVDHLATTHGILITELDKPNYLTQKERELLMNKGMEALVVSWLNAIDRTNLKRAVSHRLSPALVALGCVSGMVALAFLNYYLLSPIFS